LCYNKIVLIYFNKKNIMEKRNFFEICDKAKEFNSFFNINTSDDEEVGILISGIEEIQNKIEKYREKKQNEKNKEKDYEIIIK